MAWMQKNIDDNKSSQINMGVEQVIMITTATVLISKLTYIYTYISDVDQETQNKFLQSELEKTSCLVSSTRDLRELIKNQKNNASCQLMKARML